MATEARRKTNQGQTKAKHMPVILPEVKQWMYATYAVGEGELDRSEMHNRYKAFCESRGITPKDPAYFGKIVRHLFPNCGYRRLGGRKEGSVSHYSGIVLRRGDPARAVKSQRKPSAKVAARSGSQTEEADKLHFVIEEPQQLTSKKRGKREEEEEEEEDAEREVKEDRRLESGALTRTSKSTQRSKRTQLVVHRSFTFGPTNRQASLDMMAVIRNYRNVYRHELWGLTPTNPASMKSTLINYILYEEEGLKERSSLSFSCLTMLCIASFLQGDWGFSRSFFHLAREHLQNINDLDFDVAAALVVYGWWATFYAHTADDGKRTQLNYAKTGRKICERLGAYNDEVYWLLLNLESVNRTEQNLEIIEEVKAKYPPYKRPWKVFRHLKRPASSEWAQSFRTLNAMFQYVLTSVSVMKSPLENEEKKECRNTLLTQLNTSLILERELLYSNNRPCDQTFNMLMTFNYALRALIYSLLGSTKAVNAAEDLFNFLLQVPAPMMLISMHGLVVAEYVLIRTVTDVLVGSGHHQLLKKMLKRIDNSKINDGFYWLTYVCTYIESKLEAPHLPSALAPLQLRLDPIPKMASQPSGSAALRSPAPSAVSPSHNPPPSAYASSFTSPPTTATPVHPSPSRHLTELPRPTPPPAAVSFRNEREYQLAHADLRRHTPDDQPSTMAPYLPPIPAAAASSYGARPQPSYPSLRPSYPPPPPPSLPPQSPYPLQSPYPPQLSYPPPPTALFPQHAPPREPSWATLRLAGFDDGATFNTPLTQQRPRQDMYAAPPGYSEAPGMPSGYSRHMPVHPPVQTQQWPASSDIPGMPSGGRPPLRAHLYHDAPRHYLSSSSLPIPSSRSSPANAVRLSEQPPLNRTPFNDDVYQHQHHQHHQHHFEPEHHRTEHQHSHRQGQQYHHVGSTREWSAHVVSSEDDYDSNSSPPALRRAAAAAGLSTLSSSPPGLGESLSLDALRGRVLHSAPPQPQRLSPRHHYPPAGGYPHDSISFLAPREPSWATLRLPGLDDGNGIDEGDQLDRNVSALFSLLERSRHDPHFAPSGPPHGRPT